MRKSATMVLVIFAGGFLAATALAGGADADIEVIYTKKAGDPKAQVPGQLDLAGMPVATEWRALEDLIVSPDGTTWFLKGRNQLGSDLETLALLGKDDTGDALAQEGQPIPGGATGELFDFFSTTLMPFNEDNDYGFACRARGGLATVFQKVMYWDGTSLKIVAQMGDSLVGLSDPDGAGNETAGNSIGSIQILNDGRFTAHDTTIVNINSLWRPAIFYSDSIDRGTSSVVFTKFKQRNADSFGGSTIVGLDSATFENTPDGSSWMTEASDSSGTATDKILVVNDVVVMKEGSSVDMSTGGSSPPMADIFANRMVANGDWIARGDYGTPVVDNDWFVINGVLIAQTGDLIVTSLRGGENWGAIFSGMAANNNGDWVLVGNTDNVDLSANEIILYYNAAYDRTEIVAREGDPVDLDGNGMFDDTAFIGRATNTLSAFAANDVWLTDDGLLYFIANLHDGAGNDLNSNPVFGTPEALMRLLVDPCPTDLDKDGDTDVFDLFILLDSWDTDGDGAVIALPRNNVDVFDLFEMLDAWGDCFPAPSN